MNKLRSALDRTLIENKQVLNRIVPCDIPSTSSQATQAQSSISMTLQTNSNIVIEKINKNMQSTPPKPLSKLKFTKLQAPESESSCDEADESDEELRTPRASSLKANSSYSAYSASTPTTSVKRRIDYDRSTSPIFRPCDTLPSTQAPNIVPSQFVNLAEVKIFQLV